MLQSNSNFNGFAIQIFDWLKCCALNQKAANLNLIGHSDELGYN